MKKLLIGIINFYQKNISRSKLNRGCCRFIPTCSCYAIEAIEVHGAFYGSYLAIKRLLRCNPLFKGGYDPVPPKKERLKQGGKN